MSCGAGTAKVAGATGTAITRHNSDIRMFDGGPRTDFGRTRVVG
jgi:hypothetical protein